MSVVAVLDADFDNLELERSLLSAAGHELVEVDAAPAPEGVEGLLVMWRTVDAAELDRWPALRVVGRFGLGVDNIDLEAAAARRVGVVNSGEYSTEEVTTQAVALTLAVLRQVVRGDRSVRAGEWFAAIDNAAMARVSELTVGVIGLGRIGRRVGRTWSTAFGCEVIGYDPFAHVGDEPIRQVDELERLLADADVVSLHSPLSEATQHMIGAPQLRAMRPGAVLVNVARGGLVDEAALTAALESEHLGGAALDVFEQEPLPGDSPLTRMPNVVLSPHVGYLSPPALEQARRQTIEDLVAVLAGRPPSHTLGV